MAQKLISVGSVASDATYDSLRTIAIKINENFSEVYGGDVAVNFTQSGSGAVVRTVQDKARETVSAFDFIPVPLHAAIVGGTSTVDLTTYLQNAINAAPGELLFPAGMYSHRQLKPRANLTIRGVVGQSILKNIGGSGDNFRWNSNSVAPTDPALINFHMIGLTIDGNSVGNCLQINGLTDCSFTDVIFRNAWIYGCALQARPGFIVDLEVARIHFTRCGFENNGRSDTMADGKWDGLDIKHCEDTTLTDCWATGNSNTGINIRGKDVQLVNCRAEGNQEGFNFQPVVDQANNPSYFVVANCLARGNGWGFFAQASNLVEGAQTTVHYNGCQSYDNTNDGFNISGSGQAIVILDAPLARGNQTGIRLTGDYAAQLHINDPVMIDNTNYGIRLQGKNALTRGGIITGSLYGYVEESTAANNLLDASVRIFGNSSADISRNGAEPAYHGMTVQTPLRYRLFPGATAGIEMQIAADGTASRVVAVGDATSVNVGAYAKGTGKFVASTNSGARTLMQARPSTGSAVNYMDVIATATGAPVEIRSAGADTNVGLLLKVQGTSAAIEVGSPFKVMGTTFAALPNAPIFIDCLIRISDRSNRLAISDGTSWRFMDGVIVS